MFLHCIVFTSSNFFFSCQASGQTFDCFSNSVSRRATGQTFHRYQCVLGLEPLIQWMTSDFYPAKMMQIGAIEVSQKQIHFDKTSRSSGMLCWRMHLSCMLLMEL
ncbi:hypothetical protein O6H91_19G008100 [Diphasiastrum complanatum]|uniref:Uncharacterized protein n=1 Tax=Diphasiastrum complanatum TaxID=34168 RepID=A0ACC2ASM4_DIPCM|nr:hypothetical protein O6H91_19G008100 [Diphasiastrum complanatum]